MSSAPPPMPTPPPNPRAEAAAAKAYNKANRPWFKKKRILIPAAIVIIAAIAIGAGGGGGASDSDGNSNSDAASQDNPAALGTSAQNKSAKYTVNSVENRTELNQFGTPPAGTFVVVTVTVENVKDETIQVSNSDFTLQVNGTEIDASSEGYLLDDAFSFTDLSPSLSRTGTIVFDVPTEFAGQGVLKVQAVLSTDEEVFLSLT